MANCFAWHNKLPLADKEAEAVHDEPCADEGDSADPRPHKVHLLLLREAGYWTKRRHRRLQLDKKDLMTGEISYTLPHQTKDLTHVSLEGSPAMDAIPPYLATQLHSLRSLNLSKCDILELPLDWDLPQLKSLDLSFNRLMDFPKEALFRGLPQLRELNLYGNKIFRLDLPRDTKNVLSRLEILNLGYNQIPFLPQEMGNLPRLKRLLLAYNFLESFPENMCRISTLSFVDLCYNPISVPPLEVCERGIVCMRRYYEKTHVRRQGRTKVHKQPEQHGTVQPKCAQKIKPVESFSRSLFV